jgi:RHS repeat-associated protein
MRLIEQGREEYYKQLGIPPGPPTMKGIYGEPESTGDELPNGMLGNYDAPTNWPKTVIFNPQGDVPGPLIQWGDPQIPSIEAGYGFAGNGKPENNQYFYHSDHLGSTSYITDRQGNAEQFIVYMPYGEVLTEEHGSWESPYKFNGKEQDAETGLYYYGARYYEPNVAMWYGVDPMAEKHPNVGGYVYCLSSPLRYIDPTGMTEEEREAAANKAQEYLEKNPGGTYQSGAMGEPGENVDCSGMVRQCIKASGLPDPASNSKGDGEWQNGVALIANADNVREVGAEQARVGDILTINTGRNMGTDGKYDHIGIITSIDEDGGIHFVHAGSKGPSQGVYKPGGSNYWDDKVKGFYQWDTPDNNSAPISTSAFISPQYFLSQGKAPTFTQQLKSSHIPIISTLGDILGAFIK